MDNVTGPFQTALTFITHARRLAAAAILPYRHTEAILVEAVAHIVHASAMRFSKVPGSPAEIEQEILAARAAIHNVLANPYQDLRDRAVSIICINNQLTQLMIFFYTIEFPG